MSKRKSLIPIKQVDFNGIKKQINPLSDINSLYDSMNVESHVKPGILTNRETETLLYPAPHDFHDRIENQESISFENYNEKSAKESVEVTVLVNRGEVVAPKVSGNKITDFKYRGIQIWIRPCWTGFYWVDQWEWLNEAWISKIKTAPDAVYKNRIVVHGDFDKVGQWVIVNVDKNNKVPAAILNSTNNGTDTTIWISLFENNWEVDDDVVIMRNYIPFDNNYASYYTDRRNIGFYKIFDKIRIGFGSIKGATALSIDYVKNLLTLRDYEFDDVDPLIEGKEYLFALENKLQLSTYIPFNQDNNFQDFKLNITEETAGNYDAGTYYFRMTALIENASEILVNEQSITTVDDSKKFLITPLIRLGSLNKRVNKLKVYFSDNGDDYYFFQEFVVFEEYTDETLTVIPTHNWKLLQDGYLKYYKDGTETNMYLESSAASPSDTNERGSWLEFDESRQTISVVAASSYAIKIVQNTGGFYDIRVVLKNSAFNDPGIEAGQTYKIDINCKCENAPVSFEVYWGKYYSKTNNYIRNVIISSSIPIKETYDDYTIEFKIPPDITDPDSINKNAELCLYLFFVGDGLNTADSYVLIESFAIEQISNNEVNSSTELGAQDLDIMGYQPTFNMVRDWSNGVTINDIVYIGASYIEKKYDDKLFSSHVGAESNQYDALTNQKVIPVDKQRGEPIVGMVVLGNLNILIATTGGGVIVNPLTGQTTEVARGYGLKSKMTLVPHRGFIFWGAEDDLIVISSSSGYEPQLMSDVSIRGLYKALEDKSYCSACIDKFGSYRFGFAVQNLELLSTNRGWFPQKRDNNPVVFRNGSANRVWFMDNDGNIYALPADVIEDIGYADVYGDYRSGW